MARNVAEELVVASQPVNGVLPMDFQNAFRAFLREKEYWPEFMQGNIELLAGDSTVSLAILEGLSYAAQNVLRKSFQEKV